MMTLNRYLTGQKILFCCLAMLVLAGCTTVQYVSRYDAATEAQINKIQQQVETLFSRIEKNLGKPEADYKLYVDAYSQLHIDANILYTRAQAIDLNRITVEQSAELIQWLKGMEELHKTGIVSADLLSIPRTQAQQIFVAMLKFELAKKRQLDPAIISKE
jgi:hypothetical protein